MGGAGQASSKELRVNWVKIGPWIPVPLAIVVALGIMQAGPQLPRPEFYETAAQIIPVLVVTLAIENQAHRLWARLSFGYKLDVFIFLALGELAAILAASRTISALPDAAAQDDTAELGPRAKDEIEAAISVGDPQRLADVLRSPLDVVERELRLNADADTIVANVFRDRFLLDPDLTGQLVGPDAGWSSLLAAVTVAGLVFGFVAVLLCAFVPKDRLPEWATEGSITGE